MNIKLKDLEINIIENELIKENLIIVNVPIDNNEDLYNCSKGLIHIFKKLEIKNYIIIDKNIDIKLLDDNELKKMGLIRIKDK